MQTDHIPEESLHLYLDGELDSSEQGMIALHIGDCATCAEALRALEALSAALDTVPEQALSRDLTPAVLESIQPAAFPWAAGKWLVSLQIGVAFIVLFYSWPRIVARLTSLPWQWPGAELNASGQAIASQLSTVQAMVVESGRTAISELIDVFSTAPTLSWTVSGIWPWAAALGLLWLTVNGLLIRPSSASRDQT